MLQAHKLLDAMQTGVGIAYTEGTRQNEVNLLYQGLQVAEKYDFGNLPFERGEEGTSAWRLPDLTLAEKSFWVDGLIFLPAPICWFEYQMGNNWTGILVTDGTQKDADDDGETSRSWAVIPRYLVGHADRGSVTREFRVLHP